MLFNIPFSASLYLFLSCNKVDSKHFRQKEATVYFRVALHLVKCKNNKDRKSATYCKFDDSKIWFTSVVSDDFYRHASYDVKLKCNLWSEEGSFKIYLSSNLTTSPTIGSSGTIKVVNNKKFAIDSFFSAVLPCQPGLQRFLVLVGRHHKCVQTGRFLKGLGDKFSLKSSQIL